MIGRGKKRKKVGILNIVEIVLKDKKVLSLRKKKNIMGNNDEENEVIKMKKNKEIENMIMDSKIEWGSGLVGNKEIRIKGNRNRDNKEMEMEERNMVREDFKKIRRIKDKEKLKKIDREGKDWRRKNKNMMIKELIKMIEESEKRIEDW